MPEGVDLKDEASAGRLGSVAFDQSLVKAKALGGIHSYKISDLEAKGTIPDWIQRPELKDSPPKAPKPPPAIILPSLLGPFESGTITFDRGVPVGGSMSLTVYQGGNYILRGHFHDSGAPNYKIDIGWALVDSKGKVFFFVAEGTVHGTLSFGSRDWDFISNANNQELAAAWSDICAGYTLQWTVHVNWDAKSTQDDLLEGIKAAGTIVTAVTTVVALV